MVSPLLTLKNKIKWCMLKEGLHLYHWANQLIKVIWRNSKPTERKLVGTLKLMIVLHENSPEHFLPYLLIPSMIVLHENSPEQRWAHVPVGFRVPRARVPRFFLRVPRSCTTCISRYPALLRSYASAVHPLSGAQLNYGTIGGRGKFWLVPNAATWGST